MALTSTISLSDVFTQLRTWLLTIVNSASVEVVRGQDNGVPMPKGDFIVMTQRNMKRISTPVEGYTDPITTIGTKDITAPTQLEIALDFYGTGAAEVALMVQALFRNSYGDEGFTNPAIKPLYAEDPVQMPLLDAEKNYTQRWMVLAALQINPVIKPAQDFAGTLTATTISVERTYPA